MQIKEKIDLNCDLAQSFGVYKNDSEYELLDYVSSASISCGFHAGDPLSIRKALLAVKEKNVAIGAHIGFDDIKGFGNNNMDLSQEEIEAIVIYQIGALASFAKSYGLVIEYVRPHGAMYKRAAVDFEFSLAIANAVSKFDKWLTYYGAASEILDRVEDEACIKVAHEVQLNKIYTADGLIDYEANSVESPEFAVTRLSNLLRTSEIRNKDGGLTEIKCDTIHFSSVSPNIIEIAKRINTIIKPTPIGYNNAALSGWV